MSPLSLAEVLAEGERVLTEHATPGLDEQEVAAAARVVAGYSLIYLPRLLAVARAAMEMRAVFPRGSDHTWVLAAFDAAARGETP